MRRFDHPNVLGLIGVCIDAGPAPYVVMPFMANGSLLHYLKKERPNILLPLEVDEDVVSNYYATPNVATLTLRKDLVSSRGHIVYTVGYLSSGACCKYQDYEMMTDHVAIQRE